MNDLDEPVRRAVQKLEPRRQGVVAAGFVRDVTAIAGTAGLDGESVFEIGSVSKVFTTSALARLVETGLPGVGAVRLDQPLGDFFPAPSGITLRHLATHTSGLPRLPRGMLLPALLRPHAPDPYRHCTADFLIANLARIRPGRPGRRYHYSNLGVGLLGLALARHTGLPFEQLINTNFDFLRSTGTGLTTVPGHRADGRPAAPWHLADLAGAGGLRSTVTDLVAFVRAHCDPGLPGVRLALETEFRINPFMSQRLGWMARRLHERAGGHTQIFHNGQTGGFASFAGFDPVDQVGVVVLSATARSVDTVAFELLKELQSRT
ncbi:serine hydrolase domain-containing protein [Actinoplanes couchii]|uniref:Beta-lactamase n=1 Tax=Actinoplanes couchii TaxID=403638 RepID=A0ABQ3XGG2_9ACTN|nr:serine hydrolase domain-containing protein [Actinoplanes couchii]MDR6320999.1 CubicO group peptidase (beta-lactamase class C family) [Actinoplanes couchii]GID57510.1 serine hydrolase [Actinoplanes couchii]